MAKDCSNAAPDEAKPLPAAGVDVGGVIVTMAGVDRQDTSFFGDNPNATPEQPDAVRGLWMLNRRFAGRVYVISKAGPRTEAVTHSWFESNDIFRRTGIRPESLFFVRERADKAILAKRLEITHFIDDRIDVLQHMTSVAHRYLFLPGRDGLRRLPVPGWATPVADWHALDPLIFNTVDEFRGTDEWWTRVHAHLSLEQLMSAAGVMVLPADRDLAAPDHRNDDGRPF